MTFHRTTRRVLSDPLFGTQPIAGIKKATEAAKGAASTAASTGGKYGAEAEDIGSTLVPTLKGDVTHPTGLAPEQQNAMLVRGEEGLGGATSGLAGEAGLRAVRSRNTGATSGVLDELAREKMRTSAGVGLDVATKQAELQQQQRAQALKQLQGLFGTDVEAGLKAQGLVPEDINAWANANKTGWLQDTLDTVNTLTGAAKTAKGMMPS
jgi:hypothetical protein